MEKLVPICVLILGVILSVAYGQGQFHSSDPVGNFKVAYTASGGHYLVEDRTADGTSHLGNFGYQSSGGEQVGVAYGTDGAGFVIRAPGASSSYSGGGGGGGVRGGGGRSGGGGGVSYNAVSGHQDPYLRYQELNYPSSNAATSSDLSTYSSLPASDFTTTTTTYSTQTSAYQPEYGAGQSYSSAASYAALPSSSHSYSSSSSYQSPLSYPSQTNYWDTVDATTPFYRQPFTYSFSSYNDPYAPRYTPPPPSPPPQPVVPQYTPPAPTLTTLSTVAPQVPTVIPQQFSYQQSSPSMSLDQLAQKLQAKQREHAQTVSSLPQYQTLSSVRHTPTSPSYLQYSIGTPLPYYSLLRPIY